MASELRNLDADLPTTSDDVRALRAAREGSAMSPEQIARTLTQLGHPPAAELRARRGPRGESFTLTDEA